MVNFRIVSFLESLCRGGQRRNSLQDQYNAPGNNPPPRHDYGRARHEYTPPPSCWRHLAKTAVAVGVCCVLVSCVLCTYQYQVLPVPIMYVTQGVRLLPSGGTWNTCSGEQNYKSARSYHRKPPRYHARGARVGVAAP